MSQWTHVAGCIRIDCLPDIQGDPNVTAVERFGKTVTYYDPQEKWDECNVPRGSEGSVQYRVARTGDDHSLSWGVVYVWGDLRDYQNPTEIFEWLKRACEGHFDFMVRNCAVVVEVERQKSYIIHDYLDEQDVTVRLVMDELVVPGGKKALT